MDNDCASDELREQKQPSVMILILMNTLWQDHMYAGVVLSLIPSTLPNLKLIERKKYSNTERAILFEYSVKVVSTIVYSSKVQLGTSTHNHPRIKDCHASGIQNMDTHKIVFGPTKT